MSYKVFIGVGHGGKDPGAKKYLVEKDVNLVMALACRNYLAEHGVNVSMSREIDENDPINEEVRECNKFDPDLAIDIHCNASAEGKAKGFEAYYYSKGGKSKELAKNIENEVIAIGQSSRGCKTRVENGREYYAFIRDTKCPAVICEGLFVDNDEDFRKADTAQKQAKFGVAYAKGILKTLGV